MARTSAPEPPPSPIASLEQSRGTGGREGTAGDWLSAALRAFGGGVLGVLGPSSSRQGQGPARYEQAISLRAPARRIELVAFVHVLQNFTCIQSGVGGDFFAS